MLYTHETPAGGGEGKRADTSAYQKIHTVVLGRAYTWDISPQDAYAFMRRHANPLFPAADAVAEAG